MLLASPELDDLYHKSCALAEDPSDARDNAQHPARMLQFLVGLKGKNEPMAIGGPWSPSLDGNNPAEDPRVLINTAIRTTKYLTGIDLSNCTRWYVPLKCSSSCNILMIKNPCVKTSFVSCTYTFQFDIYVSMSATANNNGPQLLLACV